MNILILEAALVTSEILTDINTSITISGFDDPFNSTIIKMSLIQSLIVEMKSVCPNPDLLHHYIIEELRR